MAVAPVAAALGVVAYAATLLGGSFDNFGGQLTDVWTELSLAFFGITNSINVLSKMFWDLVKPVWDLIPGTENLVGGFDALKFVLFPVVATFQLVEVVLRTLIVTFDNLALGFAKFVQFLSNLPGIKGTPIGGALSGIVSGMGISQMEKKLAEDQAVLKDTLKQHNDYYKNWNAHSKKTEDVGKSTENTQTSMLSTLKGSWKTATSQSGVLENLKKLLEQVVNKLALMIPAGAAGATGVGGMDNFASTGGDFSKWDPRLLAETANVDRKYGLPLGTTAALFMQESSGQSNKRGGAGNAYVGLWQAGAGALSDLGTTQSQFLASGAVGQTKLLPKYLEQHGFKKGMGVKQFYATVLGGNPGASGADSFGTTAGSGAAKISRWAPQAATAIRNSGGMPSGGNRGGNPQGWDRVSMAGNLGKYMQSSGAVTGSIWQHPWFGGNTGKHARPDYHGLHRGGYAIDLGGYANEQGPILAAVNKFNSMYGLAPKELFYAGNDPTGEHKDHVHVAYAFGAGMPAFFNSQRAAVNWERSMMPPGASVRSVTSNTSEGLGGAVVTAPITIYGAGHNAQEIAAEVIFELNRAVTEVRAASLYG